LAFAESIRSNGSSSSISCSITTIPPSGFGRIGPGMN
jgi:hypothetical protein